METLFLIRTTKRPDATLGWLVGDIESTMISLGIRTLELPWRDNKPYISCIPPGTYTCIRRWSQKYGAHWHVTGVKNRSLILIHKGNYTKDIEGCIAVGMGVSDINKDGIPDVVSSKKAYNLFMEYTREFETFTLRVI